MSSLLELTASLVSAHVSSKHMSSDEMLLELQKVYASLKALESGTAPVESSTSEQPKLTLKQAFKKDEVVCMVCGKGGFKTLKRHLAHAHDLKPSQYRKQFNISSSIPLVAKEYSESRRQMAIDRNLGDGLAKARVVRAAGKKAILSVKVNAKAVPVVKATKTKVNTSNVKETAPVPMKRTKAPVPMKTSKAPVPMKTGKAPDSEVKDKTGITIGTKTTKAPIKTGKKPAAPKSTKVKK